MVFWLLICLVTILWLVCCVFLFYYKSVKKAAITLIIAAIFGAFAVLFLPTEKANGDNGYDKVGIESSPRGGDDLGI